LDLCEFAVERPDKMSRIAAIFTYLTVFCGITAALLFYSQAATNGEEEKMWIAPRTVPACSKSLRVRTAEIYNAEDAPYAYSHHPSLSVRA
jgi:hypothetical protein